LRHLPSLLTKEKKQRPLQDVFWKDEMVSVARKAGCGVTAHRAQLVLAAHRFDPTLAAAAVAPGAAASSSSGAAPAAAAAAAAGSSGLVGLLAPTAGVQPPDPNPSNQQDFDWPVLSAYLLSGAEQMKTGPLHVNLDAVNLLTAGDILNTNIISPARPKEGKSEVLLWAPSQVAVVTLGIPHGVGAHHGAWGAGTVLSV
jgi:hypothetical protein